jgi:murein DD-endopeptidase MepM/ murein hydrolase activator NlpD
MGHNGDNLGSEQQDTGSEDIDTGIEAVDTTTERSDLIDEIIDGPHDISIESFIRNGSVDLEAAELYKDSIPTNVLETLNQMEPGLLFDLYVEEQENGEYLVDFGGNLEADETVGLSQLLRGHSMSAEFVLTGIRALTVTDYDGETKTSKREGLMGNFYAANGRYQEIHSGYVFKVDLENGYDEAIEARVDEAIADAEMELENLPPDFLEEVDTSEVSLGRFEWNEVGETYEKVEEVSRESLLKHVYLEALLNDVDPFLALSVLENEISTNTLDEKFESRLQWTIRGIKDYEMSYEQRFNEKPKDENGMYTGEFLVRLYREAPLSLTIRNPEQLFKTYGDLRGVDIEMPEEVEVASWGDLEHIRGIQSIVPGGRLTSGFGYRKPPVKGASSFHSGIDIGAPAGTSALAFASGEVIRMDIWDPPGRKPGGGNKVYIQHDNGWVSTYSHFSAFSVSIGQRIEKGQEVGKVGTTGISTGNHLHFSLSQNGQKYNPLDYLGGTAPAHEEHDHEH